MGLQHNRRRALASDTGKSKGVVNDERRGFDRQISSWAALSMAAVLRAARSRQEILLRNKIIRAPFKRLRE